MVFVRNVRQAIVVTVSSDGGGADDVVGNGGDMSSTAATSDSQPQNATAEIVAADRDSLVTTFDNIPDTSPSVADEFLVTQLQRLRQVLHDATFPLAVPEVAERLKEKNKLVDQLDDYLIPRLSRLDAPLLAVVGGSTGAGKSTLVNSLLREQVSRSGVLRPTTRAPVLVYNEHEEAWFTGDRILPSLARLTGDDAESTPDAHGSAASDVEGKISSLRMRSSSFMPAGLAMLDAPDIDSVVEANRVLANQLLSAADLWIFVTTAARYADAVPWQLLKQAAAQGTSIAVVLDRVPPEALYEVRMDLGEMLKKHHLAGSPLFAIAESELVDGYLPDEAIRELAQWLLGLATDAKQRALVVRKTLTGALDSLEQRVPELAGAAREQSRAHAVLLAELDAAFNEADKHLKQSLSDGTLLRGEVLARWQEFVGTGEFFRNLESAIGRFRDRMVSVFTNRPAPAEPLGEALHSSVAALVIAQAEDAVDDAVQRWRATDAGKAIIRENSDITKLSADFDARIERVIRDWQGYVFDLVREEGQGRRTQARIMSLGVNAVGITLMLVSFAHTGGMLIAPEVGIAGGTALVGQRLLEAIFGEQAVRSLATKARTHLMERVNELLESEKVRFSDVLKEYDVDLDAEVKLTVALREVQSAR